MDKYLYAMYADAEEIRGLAAWAESARIQGRPIKLAVRRYATVEDVPDYTGAVIEHVAEWIWDSDVLGHDDERTGAVLPNVASPEREAVRAAILAYTRKHIDLTGAPTLDTGWTLTVYPDGRIERPDVQQALLDCAEWWWGDVEVDLMDGGLGVRHNGEEICVEQGDEGWIATWSNNLVADDTYVCSSAEEAIEQLYLRNFDED